jgi:hypothetical protein
MLGTFKTGWLAVALVGLSYAQASAEIVDPVKVFVSGELEISGSPLVAVGSRFNPGQSDQMDYAIFVHELAAYITKEILPDSADEYEGSSMIPSHLSTGMPEGRSRFGAHCLTVLGQIGSELPAIQVPYMNGDSPSMLAQAARAGAALLAVHQVWSAFRNDVEDNRTGFSLNPKVSARKIGVNLTFHW